MDTDSLFRKFGRFFPAGTVLFEQGQGGSEMYVVCSGRVEIVRQVRGRETVLAVLPPGEFFGEMAIINNQPRSATARTPEDSRLLVIDGQTFESMIRSNTEIAVRMIKKLAGRLDAMGRQVEALLFRDPNARVVHCLQQEAEHAGVPHPAGVAVEITHEQLAERLGLAVDEVRTVVDRLERADLLTRAESASGPAGVFVVAEVGKLQEFIEFLDLKRRASEA